MINTNPDDLVMLQSHVDRLEKQNRLLKEALASLTYTCMRNLKIKYKGKVPHNVYGFIYPSEVYDPVKMAHAALKEATDA